MVVDRSRHRRRPGRARVRAREQRPLLGAARRRRQLRRRHELRVRAAPGRPRDRRRRDRLARRRGGDACSRCTATLAARGAARADLRRRAAHRAAGALARAKEVHGKPIVALFVCYSGPLADGEKLLAPIKAFGAPVGDIVQRRPVRVAADAARRDPAQGPPLLLEVGVPARASNPDSSRRRSSTRGRIVSPHSAILIFPLGGALNRLPEDHSAVGNRDAAAVLNIAGAWERAEDDAANIEWARARLARPAPVLDRRHLRQLPDRGGRRRAHARGVSHELRAPGRDQGGMGSGESVAHEQEHPATIE